LKKGAKLTAGENDKNRHVVCIPVISSDEQAFKCTWSGILDHSVIAAPILIVDMTDEKNKTSDLISSLNIRSSNLHNDVLIEKAAHDQSSDELACALSIYCHSKFSIYDFLFVKPGIELPYAWDARLNKVAYSCPSVATVSPLCDFSPFFTLLDLEILAGTNQYKTDDIDSMAYCLGHRTYYQVPRFFEGCFYMRRDAWREIKNLDEILAIGKGRLGPYLAKRIESVGRLNVVCDHLYVGSLKDHNSSDIYQNNISDLNDSKELVLNRHPLTYVRCTVEECFKKEGYFSSLPGLEPKPVQLHIMHSWGGGMEKWIRDYTSASEDSINMILKSVGSPEAFGYNLSLFTNINDTYPVRTWGLSMPIFSTSITHLEYHNIIQQIIREFSIDVVIISSLVGHSLDALNTGKKTIIVCHDYYPFCPAINICSNGICKICNEERLRHCISENRSDLIRDDQTISVEGWMALRDRYLQLIEARKIAMVAPTDSVKRNMRALDPRFDRVNFTIIPHGIFTKKQDLKKLVSGSHQKMRAVVLGQLKTSKGLDLVKDSLSELCDLIDIYLVGCGDISNFWNDSPCVRIIPKYDNGDVLRILEEISPNFGLLLSMRPETFSYTLSELMVFGIPPVATSLGSFTDRIQNGINGFLFEPNKEALVSIVKSLVSNPERLESVRQNLSGYSHRSSKEMVEDYRQLLQIGEVKIARYKLCISKDVGWANQYTQVRKSYNKLIKDYERVHQAYKETHDAYEKRTDGYNQLQQAFEQLQKAYTSKEDNLEQVWRELQKARAEIQEARDEIQKARDEIQEIHGSFYWKVGHRTQKIGHMIKGIIEKK
jgi:glycosyltransferase involved in cell wall biosynthesis/exonuclease VII small subunit